MTDLPSTSREEAPPPSRALLIGAYRSGSERTSCKEHLDELERLADTYGLETVTKEACSLRKIDVATFIGSGKLDELVEKVRSLQVDIVLFDDEIAPSQQRNLERRFQVTVMDRTELILGVFDIHARTHEARLQIELAEARYTFPRLRRMWTHLSRQTGGAAYLKGAGEKQIEIDRRLLQQRVTKIEGELKEVAKHRQLQRAARIRSGIPSFAIVGYTNAGKSTLLNALTEAGVLVEDMLFATLDTTTRKFLLPNKQSVLLIDTVGFIRKLPHELVAAFQSTLDEALVADILLHLVDISHPSAVEQAQASYAVLEQLKATMRPIITVLNKIDQCDDLSRRDRMRLLYPKTVAISAKTGEGFDDLLQLMMNELSSMRREIALRIPQSEYVLVSTILREGEVLEQDYEGNDVLIRALVPATQLHKFAPYIEQ